MPINLNDVRSLNHRLLELLPHQPLKQFAGKKATSKAKAIEILLDKLKVKNIHDFVARNIYTCKQHVFLLSPTNGQTITKYCDLSAVNNEFKVISSDGTPPSCESTYLHKVTQSFISLEPLRKVELDFLLPIRVRQTDLNQEIERIQPSFMILDIEGGEYEFLRHARLGPIRKIVIEVHPHVLGYSRISEMLGWLFAAGFALDLGNMRKNVFYLFKETVAA